MDVLDLNLSNHIPLEDLESLELGAKDLYNHLEQKVLLLEQLQVDKLQQKQLTLLNLLKILD